MWRSRVNPCTTGSFHINEMRRDICMCERGFHPDAGLTLRSRADRAHPTISSCGAPLELAPISPPPIISIAPLTYRHTRLGHLTFDLIKRDHLFSLRHLSSNDCTAAFEPNYELYVSCTLLCRWCRVSANMFAVRKPL